MKLNPMERADIVGSNTLADTGRCIFPMGVALAIHLILFWALSYVPKKPLSVPTPPIAVKLVIAEPAPNALTPPASNTPEPPKAPIKPKPLAPEPEPEPKVERPVVAIILVPTLAPPSPLPAPPIPAAPKVGDLIPDRWRLPAGANTPLDKTQKPTSSQLNSLVKAMECLGFNADCAAQRKSIFSEDQLSGTDLVWMANYPHSGLSNSDLYGLSEAQIRERLGIPTAGKNGFMILPGIGIDGPLWDALHGVNKACDYGLGQNDAGEVQLKKRCKALKPSSKDRIGFILKPVE